MNLKSISFVLILFFLTLDLGAVIYNTPTTPAYVTVLNQAVDKAARGFVFFTNGVSFRGGVDVGLAVPINGNIVFGYTSTSTSRLTLETDLTIGSTAGTYTNQVKVRTPAGFAEIDGKGGTINLGGDTYLPASRAFSILSDTTLDGAAHALVFGSTLTFTIASGATLTIQNATLRNLNTLNFVGVGTLRLSDVDIYLDNDWTFSGNASIGTPTLIFDSGVRIYGKNKRFIFAGGRDLILNADAVLSFESTVTFSWASQRRYGLVMDTADGGLAGSGSILYFNNSNFYVPSRGVFNGLNLKKGSVFFDNSCNIYNDANTVVTKSLQLGDAASSANNTDVYVLAGAQVLVDGYVYDATV